MAAKSIVTDLDQLISLGYERYQVKWALKATSGNKQEAIQLLSRLASASTSSDECSWRGITDEDWVIGSDLAVGHNLANQFQARDAETRGLVKSPIYTSIASFRKCPERNNEALYAIRVSLKDKRTWTVERSYQDFRDFYAKLPLSVHAPFTCRFPPIQLFQLSNESLELRLADLQGWLRELTLSEKCMTNTTILQLLYTFLKVHENGGPATVEKIQNQLLASNRFLPANAYQFQTNMKMTPTSDVSDPLSLVAFRSLLPIKYGGQALSKALGNDDVSQEPSLLQGMIQHQFMKDYNHDRVIINGKRVLGCYCPQDKLIDTCHRAIQHALSEKPHISPQSWDPDDLNRFITSCLHNITRTESAFLSHAMLSRAIDLTSNLEEQLLLVPESTLTSPIEIVFSIREKSEDSSPPSPHTRRASASMISPLSSPGNTNRRTSTQGFNGIAPIHVGIDSAAYANEELEQAKAEVLDWCIMFQAQASMVFRVCSADTLEPKLQVQTVFRKVIYGMPKQYAGNPDVTFLDSKPSSAMVYVERELRTSTRDLV